MITMTTIAREAGVSKNTVSLALRGDPQIPASTTARIQAIADRLGYRRNPTVAHLMAELRASGQPAARSTLALLNASPDPRAFTSHPTIPTYVRGCERRAASLGYALDHFWLHDPKLDGTSLNRILHSRGIRGLLVVGLMRENRLPPHFAATWDAFPAIVTGVRTRQPSLSFACVDHHTLVCRAVEEALHLGYQRPSLVLDETIDQLVDGRFTAGFHTAQQSLPARRRTRPFLRVQAARAHPNLFAKWLRRERPDVILTLYHEVRPWLANLNLHAPRDLGLIQLELRPDHPNWAGMNQHNDVVGAAAVDLLVGLIHRNESGVPEFPRGTLVGSTWTPGQTVRQATPRARDHNAFV